MFLEHALSALKCYQLCSDIGGTPYNWTSPGSFLLILKCYLYQFYQLCYNLLGYHTQLLSLQYPCSCACRIRLMVSFHWAQTCHPCRYIHWDSMWGSSKGRVLILCSNVPSDEILPFLPKVVEIVEHKPTYCLFLFIFYNSRWRWTNLTALICDFPTTGTCKMIPPSHPCCDTFHQAGSRYLLFIIQVGGERCYIY